MKQQFVNIYYIYFDISVLTIFDMDKQFKQLLRRRNVLSMKDSKTSNHELQKQLSKTNQLNELLQRTQREKRVVDMSLGAQAISPRAFTDVPQHEEQRELEAAPFSERYTTRGPPLNLDIDTGREETKRPITKATSIKSGNTNSDLKFNKEFQGQNFDQVMEGSTMPVRVKSGNPARIGSNGFQFINIGSPTSHPKMTRQLANLKGAGGSEMYQFAHQYELQSGGADTNPYEAPSKSPTVTNHDSLEHPTSPPNIQIASEDEHSPGPGSARLMSYDPSIEKQTLDAIRVHDLKTEENTSAPNTERRKMMKYEEHAIQRLLESSKSSAPTVRSAIMSKKRGTYLQLPTEPSVPGQKQQDYITQVRTIQKLLEGPSPGELGNSQGELQSLQGISHVHISAYHEINEILKKREGENAQQMTEATFEAIQQQLEKLGVFENQSNGSSLETFVNQMKGQHARKLIQGVAQVLGETDRALRPYSRGKYKSKEYQRQQDEVYHKNTKQRLSQQVNSYKKSIIKQDELQALAKSGFQFDGNANEVGQNQMDCQNLWMLAQHVKQQQHELEAKLKGKEEIVICGAENQGLSGAKVNGGEPEVGPFSILKLITDQEKRDDACQVSMSTQKHLRSRLVFNSPWLKMDGPPEGRSIQANMQAGAATLGRSSPNKGSFDQTVGSNTLINTLSGTISPAHDGLAVPLRTNEGTLQPKQPYARINRISSYGAKRRNIRQASKTETIAIVEGQKQWLHAQRPRVNGLQKNKTQLNVACGTKSKRGERQSTGTLQNFGHDGQPLGTRRTGRAAGQGSQLRGNTLEFDRAREYQSHQNLIALQNPQVQSSEVAVGTEDIDQPTVGARTVRTKGLSMPLCGFSSFQSPLDRAGMGAKMLPIPTQKFDSDVFNIDNVSSPRKQTGRIRRNSVIMSSRSHGKHRKSNLNTFMDHLSVKSGSDGNEEEIQIAQPMKLNMKRNMMKKLIDITVKDAAASAITVNAIINSRVEQQYRQEIKTEGDQIRGQKRYQNQGNTKQNQGTTIQMQFAGNQHENLMPDGGRGYKNTSQLNETGLLSFELSQVDDDGIVQDQYGTNGKAVRGSLCLPEALQNAHTQELRQSPNTNQSPSEELSPIKVRSKQGSMVSEDDEAKHGATNYHEKFSEHELFNIQILNQQQAIRTGSKSATANSKMAKAAKSQIGRQSGHNIITSSKHSGRLTSTGKQSGPNVPQNLQNNPHIFHKHGTMGSRSKNNASQRSSDHTQLTGQGQSSVAKLKINSDLEGTQDQRPLASTKRSGQRQRQSGELSIKKATHVVASLNLESLQHNDSEAIISQQALTNRIPDNLCHGGQSTILEITKENTMEQSPFPTKKKLKITTNQCAPEDDEHVIVEQNDDGSRIIFLDSEFQNSPSFRKQEQMAKNPNLVPNLQPKREPVLLKKSSKNVLFQKSFGVTKKSFGQKSNNSPKTNSKAVLSSLERDLKSSMQTGKIVLQPHLQQIQNLQQYHNKVPLELYVQQQGRSNETVEINHAQNNSGCTGSSGGRGNVIIFNAQTNRDVLIPNHGQIIIQTSRCKNPPERAGSNTKSLNKTLNGTKKQYDNIHNKFFNKVKTENQNRTKSGKRQVGGNPVKAISPHRRFAGLSRGNVLGTDESAKASFCNTGVLTFRGKNGKHTLDSATGVEGQQKKIFLPPQSQNMTNMRPQPVNQMVDAGSDVVIIPTDLLSGSCNKDSRDRHSSAFYVAPRTTNAEVIDGNDVERDSVQREGAGADASSPIPRVGRLPNVKSDPKTFNTNKLSDNADMKHMFEDQKRPQ